MDRNRDLFWELLEPEHPKVRAFCRRLAGDRDLGDDLCQESLLQALRRFHTLRDPARFRAWLYQIVLNRHRNACRGYFWRRFAPWVEEISGVVAGHDPGEQSNAQRLLERALRPLSADERALVTLFELEGWTLADLALLTGKSEGSLKVRLFRIRKKMRATLTRWLAREQHPNRSSEIIREEQVCVVTRPGID